jgi:hypothetical protein
MFSHGDITDKVFVPSLPGSVYDLKQRITTAVALVWLEPVGLSN